MDRLVAVPRLDELARDPSAAAGLPLSTLAALQAQCAAAQGAIAAAMCKPAAPSASRELVDAAALEPWLTAEELAERIPSFSKRWLYRHAGTLPFARRLSRKRLVFSLPGAQRYLATRH